MRRRRGFRLVGPVAWSLWAAPRPFRWYALVVEAIAVAVVVLTVAMVPIGRPDLAWFGVLIAGTVLHLEIMRGAELHREISTEGRLYVDLKSAWSLAGLLVLPPPLVAALIVVGYVHAWFRLDRQIAVHRWVFSCANALVASAAGGVILVAAYPHSYPNLPFGSTAAALLIVTATLARWAVNRTLAIVALLLLRPYRVTVGPAFRPVNDDMTELVALSMGVLFAIAIHRSPLLLLPAAVVLLVIHQGIARYETAVAILLDPVTRLYQPTAWYERAEKMFAWTRRESDAWRQGSGKELLWAQEPPTTLGLLLVHVNNFTALTSGYSATVGDRVLCRVAEELRVALRGRLTLVGQIPLEDFAILLADTSPSDLTEVAERIQTAIRNLTIRLDGPDNPPITIQGLTTSVGGAIYPEHAANLKDLMQTADASLTLAQTEQGDQIRLPGY